MNIKKIIKIDFESYLTFNNRHTITPHGNISAFNIPNVTDGKNKIEYKNIINILININQI
ncbi:hypothetical protein LO80_08520 [Candidatus Francisella endociliophora]|uniref:Uncharacterized protein n=1 Tax=Candidatus Francisella endociliophora TaxID=653937 RepID=A0A097ER30_9GAMM|nr:hypothetical protein LO80_08520 [Francisella sp. FSC1006]